jgi:hypothetical protein
VGVGARRRLRTSDRVAQLTAGKARAGFRLLVVGREEGSKDTVQFHGAGQGGGCRFKMPQRGRLPCWGQGCRMWDNNNKYRYPILPTTRPQDSLTPAISQLGWRRHKGYGASRAS